MNTTQKTEDLIDKFNLTKGAAYPKSYIYERLKGWNRELIKAKMNDIISKREEKKGTRHLKASEVAIILESYS